jgi:hypothetical protein
MTRSPIEDMHARAHMRMALYGKMRHVRHAAYVGQTLSVFNFSTPFFPHGPSSFAGMPTRELIMKIARLAGDERGDAATRAIAFAKLEAVQAAHPELFRIAGEAPATAPETATDAPGWSDVTTEDEKPAPPKGPPAWFMDLSGWQETANRNRSIVVTFRTTGREFRIVLFRHKKTPTHGWLRINTATEEQVLSQIKHHTLREAMVDAWVECRRVWSVNAAEIKRTSKEKSAMRRMTMMGEIGT